MASAYRRIRQWPSAVLALCLIAGCVPSGSSEESGSTGSTQATATDEPTSTTTAVSDWVDYTNDALLMLEENYLWSDRIDWQPIRETALREVGVRSTTGGAHQALVAALTSLHDRHTYFVYPVGTRPIEPRGNYQDPVGRRLDGGIGYLTVPAFVGGQGLSSSYATNLHYAMWEVSEPSVCGWVVDLRLNTGGHLPPMILGVGPLVGEGVVATYRGTEEPTTYEYRAPDLYLAGELAPERWGTLDTEPFPLAEPALPVAVLISNLTTSAGEGVLVAFLGRPSTRTFGTASAGLATGPTRFPLPDGAALVITTVVAHDRTGRVYEAEIAPDERIVDLFPDDEDDVVLAAAVAWLDTQACADR